MARPHQPYTRQRDTIVVSLDGGLVTWIDGYLSHDRSREAADVVAAAEHLAKIGLPVAHPTWPRPTLPVVDDPDEPTLALAAILAATDHRGVILQAPAHAQLELLGSVDVPS